MILILIYLQQIKLFILFLLELKSLVHIRSDKGGARSINFDIANSRKCFL